MSIFDHLVTTTEAPSILDFIPPELVPPITIATPPALLALSPPTIPMFPPQGVVQPGAIAQGGGSLPVDAALVR